MTFHMDYDIQIGSYKVETLKSVRIIRSVEQLSDTATIELPGSLINEALDVESKIKRGDAVSIKLGYRQMGLRTEFNGYLKTIKTDNTKIILECEDELFLWDVALKNEQLTNVSLKTLLHKVTQQVNRMRARYVALEGGSVQQIPANYKVLCDYDFTYSKFTISHATGLDVLKKVQEETKANIFFDGEFLIVTPMYSNNSWSGVTVKYDMSVNVISSELKYVKASDKKIKAITKYTDASGKMHKSEVGVDGGVKIEKVLTSSDSASLKQAAESEYNLWCYDGYEGSLTGWMLPYCQPTDVAEIRDRAQQYKNGRYYIVATEVDFSNGGGRRKITIGKKMS